MVCQTHLRQPLQKARQSDAAASQYSDEHAQAKLSSSERAGMPKKDVARFEQETRIN